MAKIAWTAEAQHWLEDIYGHYRIAYLIKDDRDVDNLGVASGALDIGKYEF